MLEDPDQRGIVRMPEIDVEAMQTGAQLLRSLLIHFCHTSGHQAFLVSRCLDQAYCKTGQLRTSSV